MSKSKELATRNDLDTRSVTIAEQGAVMKATMEDLGIDTTDLMIPRLMLMQNTSGYVGEEQAAMGDVLNSQTMEVLGGIGKPVEIIPLKAFKTIRVYNMNENPPKFMKALPFTEETAALPFTGEEEGLPVKRYLNMNFFVLLKKEIDSGEAMPAVISFKSTSLPAGKQLATQIFKLAMMKKLPYSESAMITVSKEKKGTNYYAVLGIAKGTKMGSVEQAEAEKWLSILSTVSYRIDDKAEKGPETEAQTVETSNGPY